MITDYLSFINN